MSFLGELKRRNVFRVAGVYVVVSWLLVQVASTLEEAILLPAWFDAVTVSFLAIGFPIILLFAWAFELTPEGIKRTAAVDKDESITDKTASKLDVVLVISLLIFSGAILAPRFLGETGQENEVAANAAAVADAAKTSGPGAAEVVDAKAPPEASIAVMPFADLSPRGDQEYFADGISEELLNVLAKVQALKVAGRTSSFAFKGRNEDLTEIGRVLKVAHILEGSVRSQGDRVRVTAQLIQVSDGYHLWSETYDGNLSDIFAVQDDIAQQILVALKEQLVVEAAPEVVPATRTDITAYGLFLEARDLIYTRDVAKMTRAKALLDQVISIDPEYAPSYALRAKSYLLLSDSPSSYGEIPLQEAFANADADVTQALELDPGLADAHAVRGLLNNDLGNPDFAMASLLRALELNPNSLDARNWLALSLTDNGRVREALATLKVLRDIDPLFGPAINNSVLYSRELGDYAGAVEIAREYLTLTDDPVATLDYRGRIAANEGRVADALELWLQIPEVDRGRPVISRIVGFSLRLAEDPEDHGVRDTNPGFAAITRARLGESQKALNMVKAQLAENSNQVSVQLAFIQVCAITGEHVRLLDFFEAQFGGDLNIVSTRLRSSARNVSPPFEQLARAARALGKERLFENAMQRWRESIDIFRNGGSASILRDIDDARYWALRGEADLVAEFLGSAVEAARMLSVDTFSDPIFAFTRDDPRFVALRDTNAERINAERAQLGWEQLPPEAFVNSPWGAAQ